MENAGFDTIEKHAVGPEFKLPFFNYTEQATRQGQGEVIVPRACKHDTVIETTCAVLKAILDKRLGIEQQKDVQCGYLDFRLRTLLALMKISQFFSKQIDFVKFHLGPSPTLAGKAHILQSCF